MSQLPINTTDYNFLDDLRLVDDRRDLQKSELYFYSNIPFWYTCGMVLLSIFLLSVFFACLSTAAYIAYLSQTEYDANNMFWQGDVEGAQGPADVQYIDQNLVRTDSRLNMSRDLGFHKESLLDIDIDWTSARTNSNVQIGKRETVKVIEPPYPAPMYQVNNVMTLPRPRRDKETDERTGRSYIPFPSDEASILVGPRMTPDYTRSPEYAATTEQKNEKFDYQPLFPVPLPPRNLSPERIDEKQKPKSILKTPPPVRAASVNARVSVPQGGLGGSPGKKSPQGAAGIRVSARSPVKVKVSKKKLSPGSKRSVSVSNPDLDRTPSQMGDKEAASNLSSRRDQAKSEPEPEENDESFSTEGSEKSDISQPGSGTDQSARSEETESAKGSASPPSVSSKVTTEVSEEKGGDDSISEASAAKEEISDESNSYVPAENEASANESEENSYEAASQESA